MAYRNIFSTTRIMLTIALLMAHSLATGREVTANEPVQQDDKLITAPDTSSPDTQDQDVVRAMTRLWQSTTEEEFAASTTTMQTMADGGNAEAAFQLGNFFALKSAWQDYRRAFSLYSLASSNHHAEATHSLGQLYENGWGTTMDINQAITLYQTAAQQGDVHGYTSMARLYFLGKGVTRDPDAGIAWDERAGAQGFAAAYSELSQIYCCHLYDVPQDLGKSLHYRQKAAELGSNDAQWNVAQRFLEGNGAAWQPGYGLSKMESLAAANNSDAINSLGTTYSRGRGVHTDKAKAVQYWLKAVELNNCRAMMNLAEAYDHGWGIALDAEKATQYMKQAVYCNRPAAAPDLWKLALRYQYAQGTPQDCAVAVSLYQRAATAGLPDALANVGYLYQNGCGASKPDIAKAFSAYLQGAKMGGATCQNNVGSLLSRGTESVPQDRIRGYAWLLLSTKNINETARENLPYMASTLDDDSRQKAQIHLKMIENVLRDITSEQILDDALY
ncbi:MAG TPA: tetratricopeptide repeat protein [Pseudomonadales bacterium]|nr:tetratricopeptide repeat protein [Pseudomonadales bacterium]